MENNETFCFMLYFKQMIFTAIHKDKLKLSAIICRLHTFYLILFCFHILWMSNHLHFLATSYFGIVQYIIDTSKQAYVFVFCEKNNGSSHALFSFLTPLLLPISVTPKCGYPVGTAQGARSNDKPAKSWTSGGFLRFWLFI